MTDKELQRLEHDTLDELGGVMYRAALLRTGMTEDEYLKQGGQQLIYEQLFGAVASLCISGYTPDDIVPAPQAQKRPIAPIFIADKVLLAVSCEKDGKLRIVNAGGDD